MEFNWIAIVVAAVSAFVLGGLWYGPLFGRKWMALVGITEETMASANMAMIYSLAFVLNLLAAATFSMFLGEVDIVTGATYGLVAGLFWVAGSFGVSYLFERRPLGLWLINGGYHAAQFTLFGAILGAIG
ncbi:DUF1761 domain-containing protein [Sphingomicrobium astaxanthinifaciens]|uniref:DUF1761 domain-containing protein n=1 Tax=Sphingomicrobium astaxanthinifaciens TaxID=1227949 RepID=UPI001FCB2D41|nr:DUF1761 domain-containing protein [Sphingomicrobium astaxanthinifaciens]MCJ7421480.1 DUF1761 domain-containing protein [Sphingomicrobium astaxanthinifaciens]